MLSLCPTWRSEVHTPDDPIELTQTESEAISEGEAPLGGGRAAQHPPPPPVPLGNGEPPAEQFQPYPGGTGAMMEKLARERGRAAFDRSVFTVEPWRGAVPASPDDIAFLPAHPLAPPLKAEQITS